MTPLDDEGCWILARALRPDDLLDASLLIFAIAGAEVPDGLRRPDAEEIIEADGPWALHALFGRLHDRADRLGLTLPFTAQLDDGQLTWHPTDREALFLLSAVCDRRLTIEDLIGDLAHNDLKEPA